MAAVLSIPLPMVFGYWKESLRDKNFWEAMEQTDKPTTD